ncbi:major facilitator superfamily domain-containing protein [Immersiella caudata]|uniref:Major facilitator superfamily domain-containing protein n=1 Tax=Immersiella caudata TaxID=314043 RepID=A0AA40BXH2_9PEZI|nr:major facilitator superfamily domain-containing protein [Immersiella caudata]
MMISTDALEISLVSDPRRSEEDLATRVVEDEEEMYGIDPVLERRLRRKLDRRLITLVFAAYLFAFLDRSNIGNAQTAGMGNDLGFGDEKYQWLLTIFYIPYSRQMLAQVHFLFEWFAIMWKLVPPHIWAGVTVLTWGLASTLQAVATNWEGLMVCRWFLAMAEAGFGPGVPYLLSFFYRRHELGFRCGIFLSAAPLATTFAGALAYGITSAHTPLTNWRLLFLVEGIPTLLLAIALYFLLPDSPASVSFLTPAEKRVASARAILQSGTPDSSSRLGALSLSEALAAFRSPQTWIQPLMYFSCNVSFASLPVFLPAILAGMGYSSVNAQGLTAPPYFFAFVVCLVTTYLADRTQQRGLVIITLSLVAGVGYLLLAVEHSLPIRYFGVFLAAGGVFPAIANILSWVLNNQGTDTKRGVAIAMLNIIGQCGPLLGTRMFPVGEGPYYTKGMAVCAGFMFFNALLAVCLRAWFVRENKRLVREERECDGSKGKGAVAGEGEMEGGGKGLSVVVEGAVAGGKGEGEGVIGASEMEGGWGYRYVL